MLRIVKNVMKNYNKGELMDKFITHTNEHWEKIRLRDVDFFVNHGQGILGGIPLPINVFEMIFIGKHPKTGKILISEEDRNGIWSYLSSMIRISIVYIHEKRKCVLIQTPEGLIPKYKEKYMPEIKVRENAKLWELELKYE